MTTPVDTRAHLLSEFWMDYRNEEFFQEFVEYNDLGLPLAYSIVADIVPMTDKAQEFINETFQQLLDLFFLEDDGFDELAQIIYNDDYKEEDEPDNSSD